MQTLKDIRSWLHSRDGTLFLAGFSSSNFVSDLFRGHYAWAVVSFLLAAWFLHSAHEQVGE